MTDRFSDDRRLVRRNEVRAGGCGVGARAAKCQGSHGRQWTRSANDTFSKSGKALATPSNHDNEIAILTAHLHSIRAQMSRNGICNSEENVYAIFRESSTTPPTPFRHSKAALSSALAAGDRLQVPCGSKA